MRTEQDIRMAILSSSGMTLNFASQAKFSHPKLTRRAEKRKVDTKGEGEAAASSMPISGGLVLSKLIGARYTYSGI